MKIICAQPTQPDIVVTLTWNEAMQIASTGEARPDSEANRNLKMELYKIVHG